MQLRERLVTIGKAIGVFGLLAFTIVMVTQPAARDQLTDAARRLGGAGDEPWAMALFVGVYAVSIGLGVPGMILTMVGGVAFGLWGGLALNMVGALLGCSLAFFEGRFLGRGFANRLLGARMNRLSGLADWRRAFVSFARLRLIPILPFSAVNFSAGLTRAPFSAYLAGTGVGIIPSTFLFTLFAHELIDASQEAKQTASLQLGAALMGLLLLSFAPNIIRGIRGRFGRLA